MGRNAKDTPQGGPKDIPGDVWRSALAVQQNMYGNKADCISNAEFDANTETIARALMGAASSGSITPSQAIRIEAAKAAAVAFANPKYEAIEQLWSLSVFFELFICDGGDATQGQFGPKEETATVVSLVSKP